MKNQKLVKKNTNAQNMVLEQYYVPCQCDGRCQCSCGNIPLRTDDYNSTSSYASPSATTHN